MFSYTNQKCPCCGQAFQEKDDIVVCPDCGTPHHRACWKELGHCAMQDRHGSGYSAPSGYVAPEESEKKTEDSMGNGASQQPENGNGARYCGNCGFGNQPGASFCNRCGAPLNGRPMAGDPFNPYNPYTQRSEPYAYPFDPQQAPDNREPDFDGVSVEDLDKLIGKGSFYYLTVFRRIRDFKTSGRFHFSAFFFGGMWLFYRKMYGIGLIAMLIQLILQVAQMVTQWLWADPILYRVYTAAGIDVTQSTAYVTAEQYAKLQEALLELPASELFLMFLPILLMLMGLVVWIVVGCFANRWYYRHLQKKSRRIRAQFPDDEQACNEAFRKEGSTSLGAGVLAYAMLSALLFSAEILFGLII